MDHFGCYNFLLLFMDAAPYSMTCLWTLTILRLCTLHIHTLSQALSASTSHIHRHFPYTLTLSLYLFITLCFQFPSSTFLQVILLALPPFQLSGPRVCILSTVDNRRLETIPCFSVCGVGLHSPLFPPPSQHLVSQFHTTGMFHTKVEPSFGSERGTGLVIMNWSQGAIVSIIPIIWR